MTRPGRLEERKRGDGRTAIVIDMQLPDGRRVREVFCSYKTDSKSDSERQRRRAGTELDRRNVLNERGEYLPAKEQEAADVAAQGPTFATFVERFLKDYAASKRSDFYRCRTAMLTGVWGDRPLKAITRADIDLYAAERLRVVKASTVRRELAVIAVLFKVARRWGVIESSPAVDLVRPAEPPHKTRFLTREEWDRLDAAAPPWLRPILSIAVLTGLRLKEIVGLRWEDFDRQRRTITLAGDNKTASVRTVPLSSAACEVLEGQARRLKVPFVFTTVEGGNYTAARERNRISQWTVGTMKAAGIEGASFHTLRHTAGTWLVQAKVPLVEVQKILGHSTPAMTNRYANLTPEDLRGAVESLAGASVRPAGFGGDCTGW